MDTIYVHMTIYQFCTVYNNAIVPGILRLFKKVSLQTACRFFCKAPQSNLDSFNLVCHLKGYFLIMMLYLVTLKLLQ